jgi:glycosyltransferase involved in cell wall biosynthesis
MSLRISVITAVYNNCSTISDSLDSTLSQSHPDVELVVIDGASTDGTIELMQQRYAGRLSVLISEPDKGIYDALNKGIRYATGDVIGFMHSDDVFFDHEVLARIAAAFADPEVQAVYGDLLYVCQDDLSKVVRFWRAGEFSRRRISWGWMPPHPTLFMRRTVYERIGDFDTRYRIAADYDYILRAFSNKKLSPVYIPEVLVKMRLGGSSNRSLSNIIRKSREDYSALRSNGFEGVRALAWKNLSKIRQFLN